MFVLMHYKDNDMFKKKHMQEHSIPTVTFLQGVGVLPDDMAVDLGCLLSR